VSLTFILNTLIAGLTIGALYALIALGYTLVYGIIELINFAHGDVFMVGAFLSWLCLNALFSKQLNANGGAGILDGGTLVLAIVLAFAVAMVGCGILGVLRGGHQQPAGGRADRGVSSKVFTSSRATSG